MKGSKWCRDKAAPANVPLVPIWKLSHTFLKSAVQVKAVPNSINLCDRSANGRSPECQPPRGRKASWNEWCLTGSATVLRLAQTRDVALWGEEGTKIVIIL